MKLTATSLLLACLAPAFLHAQKRMCSYPFEFEKSLLQRGDYDAYFLDNQKENSFALVLKDKKKVDYLLMDSKFKVTAKISSDIHSTIFGEADYYYSGGTVSGNEYHFVYGGRSGIEIEHVDFNKKTLNYKKLLEFPKEEKSLTSFNADNVYYALTANDKAGTLNFYIIDDKGNLTTKNVPFNIPGGVDKKRNKLSTYLANMRLFKSEEEPDLSSAVVDAKLFTYPGKFEFVINNSDNPTHIVTIQLPSLSVQEKFIAYDGIVPAGEKGDVYVSSFEKNQKLFSLILNKKNIRLAVHDLQTGSLVNKYEINEENGEQYFAQTPIAEKRLGKKEDAKEVIDIKKLIKALTKGTEGVMVTENKTGQLVVTIGTFGPIQLRTGSTGGGWQGGWQTTTLSGSPSSLPSVSTNWNPYMSYRMGTPTYTTDAARYYTKTYFKILLDPTTLKTTKGNVPEPVADQIKDYIETIDKKAKATNQFSIAKEQYYGYYDKDAKAYVIDQIRIN